MHAGNEDVTLVADGCFRALLLVDKRASVEVSTRGYGGSALLCFFLGRREELDLSPGNITHVVCDAAARVKDYLTRRTLVTESVDLSLYVFVIILVEIKVIGRNVGNDRHICRSCHAEELERRQFEDHLVRIGHLLYFIQKRRSDITAEIDLVSRLLKDLCRKRGSCGLTVRTRNGEYLAGAQIHEQFHLCRERGALLLAGHELRCLESHLRGLEYYVK